MTFGWNLLGEIFCKERGELLLLYYSEDFWNI
jgi:hypothetical protein